MLNLNVLIANPYKSIEYCLWEFVRFCLWVCCRFSYIEEWFYGEVCNKTNNIWCYVFPSKRFILSAPLLIYLVHLIDNSRLQFTPYLRYRLWKIIWPRNMNWCITNKVDAILVLHIYPALCLSARLQIIKLLLMVCISFNSLWSYIIAAFET